LNFPKKFGYQMCIYIFKKIKKNKKIKIINYKNSEKPQSDTWQSLFMVVNNLNCIRKKGSIK